MPRFARSVTDETAKSIYRMASSGMSWRRIMQLHKVSWTTIHGISTGATYKHLGLRPLDTKGTYTMRGSDALRAQVQAARAAGEKTTVTCERLAIGRSTYYALLGDKPTRKVGRPPKLSQEQRAQIRLQYQEGQSLRELARIYDVSLSTIRRIIHTRAKSDKFDPARRTG